MLRTQEKTAKHEAEGKCFLLSGRHHWRHQVRRAVTFLLQIRSMKGVRPVSVKGTQVHSSRHRGVFASSLCPSLIQAINAFHQPSCTTCVTRVPLFLGPLWFTHPSWWPGLPRKPSDFLLKSFLYSCHPPIHFPQNSANNRIMLTLRSPLASACLYNERARTTSGPLDLSLGLPLQRRVPRSRRHSPHHSAALKFSAISNAAACARVALRRLLPPPLSETAPPWTDLSWLLSLE